MSKERLAERHEDLVPSLLEEARAFKSGTQPYENYAAQVRAGLQASLEARIGERGRGGGDGLAGLRQQFRGLLLRFEEVDALCRSLLLQMDLEDIDEAQKDKVLEELAAAFNALVGIELEGRTAQMRLALSAAIRSYLGGHMRQTRTLKFQVEANAARRFNCLMALVRERQTQLTGRRDAIGADELFSRMLAVCEVNPGLLAMLGSPIFPPTQGGHA